MLPVRLRVIFNLLNTSNETIHFLLHPPAKTILVTFSCLSSICLFHSTVCWNLNVSSVILKLGIFINLSNTSFTRLPHPPTTPFWWHSHVCHQFAPFITQFKCYNFGVTYFYQLIKHIKWNHSLAYPTHLT